MIVNTNTCQFEHPHRWHEFADQIHKGPEGMATFMELANINHRAVEDHLNNRPCGGGGVVSASMRSGLQSSTPAALTYMDINSYNELDYTTAFPTFFTWSRAGGFFTAVKDVWFFVNGYAQLTVANYTDQFELVVFGGGVNQFFQREKPVTGWGDTSWFLQTSGIMHLAATQTVRLTGRNQAGTGLVSYGQLDIIVLDQTVQEKSAGG